MMCDAMDMMMDERGIDEDIGIRQSNSVASMAIAAPQMQCES